MTNYKTLIEIHHSLNCKIDQFSSIETLQVGVQVEDHDGSYDVVAMLFDSNETLLMDDVYKFDIESEDEAMLEGEYLLRRIEDWVEDKQILTVENVNLVSL